jgi:uncharacterized membrane protein YeaQ/YmgE (transglycosylase-associated protein family)
MNWGSILLFLLIGALAGWLAGLIVRGAGFGVIGNIIVGILGALIGGFIFRFFGLDPSYGFWGSLLTSTLGAVILLAIVVAIKRA